MSIYCVYHRKFSMRVVDEDERQDLLASREWFDHPIKEEIINERPIRKCARKGKNDGESSSKGI
jgi:hypothetical protein